MYAIATTSLRLVVLLGGLASLTACELIPSSPCSLGLDHLRATDGSAPCRPRIDDLDPSNGEDDSGTGTGSVPPE